MTPANSLKGIVAISSVLLALVVPATTVFAATSAYQHHSAESSRPDVANRISVCSLVTSVNRLTVTRNRPLNHETFTFPATVKSTNTSRIRALVKALCALPVIPTGVIACPAGQDTVAHQSCHRRLDWMPICYRHLENSLG
jgi:hypothetical protein